MTRRILVFAVVFAVVLAAAAACSDTAGEAPEATALTTAPPAPTTTTMLAPSTTAAPTTSPPTTDTTTEADSAAAEGDLAGAGDSLYPGLGNSGYDVLHYDLDLAVLADTATVAGLATIEAVALDDLDRFNLDLSGFDDVTATVNGLPATIARAGSELSIVPGAPLASGETFAVAVSYAGTPQPIQSRAIGFQVGWRTAADGTIYVVSEPDGASTWFPNNNHPTDKATYTFRITVPDPLVAVANGTLTDTVTDLGAVTYVYEMRQPMATYLATVVIGPFDVVDDEAGAVVGGVPLRNVLPPDLAAAPPEPLAKQGEMIAHFETLFGPYPFDVYGIAVVPDFPAALENQTLSVFGDGIMSSALLEAVLVHELAHQWFGDHVSPGDWSDIWLNEGFATYAEWLWLEHTEGPEALRRIADGTRTNLAGAGLLPPGTPPANDLFNTSVYRWGALTLQALRNEIGDEAFFATLRTYVERFGGGTARTADFVAVAEQFAGRDLTDLFDAWLYGDTIPEL